MKQTKEKILSSAISLFNEKGLVNVRLQHIADKAGISVGNLAYHYYSKKAIINAIDAEIENELGLLLAVDQDFPFLIDFDNHLSRYYFLLNSYSFYFLDILELERAFPLIHAKRKIYIERMIGQIHSWLNLNVSKGVMKEALPGMDYKLTAEAVWMTITFWLTQQRVRGTSTDAETSFKEQVWNLLFPLMSSNGWAQCEAFIIPIFRNNSDSPYSA